MIVSKKVFMRLSRIIMQSMIIVGCLMIFVLQTQAMQDFVEEIDKGCTINWTTGSLKASGYQETEKKKDGELIDSEKALMAAKRMAHNNLLKAAKSVRINGDVSVGEFAGNDENIMAKLMEMVKNTAITNQQYSTDGMVEVSMDMSFFGGFSQLVLPEEIEQVESIKSLKNNKDTQLSIGDDAKPEETHQKKEIFSGLVVDARGLEIFPAMSLRILDENNQEIYGPAFVSREIAVQKGICLFERDLLAAKAHTRVLDKPLVVKVLRSRQSKGSELIISNADALKIKSASEHLAFLKQCQVIIVVDQQDVSSNNS